MSKENLQRRFPVGTQFGFITMRRTEGGNILGKLVVVEDGKVTDVSLPVAAIHNCRRDNILGGVWTKDPETLIAGVAITLHNDHKALGVYRV